MRERKNNKLFVHQSKQEEKKTLCDFLFEWYRARMHTPRYVCYFSFLISHATAQGIDWVEMHVCMLFRMFEDEANEEEEAAAATEESVRKISTIFNFEQGETILNYFTKTANCNVSVSFSAQLCIGHMCVHIVPLAESEYLLFYSHTIRRETRAKRTTKTHTQNNLVQHEANALDGERAKMHCAQNFWSPQKRKKKNNKYNQKRK